MSLLVAGIVLAGLAVMVWMVAIVVAVAADMGCADDADDQLPSDSAASDHGGAL